MRSAAQRPLGLSLVEVTVSLTLAALVMLFILNLIPSGVLALRKAQDVQAASAYGYGLMEDATAALLSQRSVPASTDVRVTLNDTEFHVTRTVLLSASTPPCSGDVRVRVEWGRQPVPMTFFTTVYLSDLP